MTFADLASLCSVKSDILALTIIVNATEHFYRMLHNLRIELSNVELSNVELSSVVLSYADMSNVERSNDGLRYVELSKIKV